MNEDSMGTASEPSRQKSIFADLSKPARSGGFAEITQFLQENFAEISEPAIPLAIAEVKEPVGGGSFADIIDPIVNEQIQAPETNSEPVEAPTQSEKGPIMEQPDASTGADGLDDLSVEDLRRHQEEVQRKIEEKQRAEKQAVIDQIVHVVNTYKIPIEELVEALGGIKVKRKGVKATMKYQDPKTGTVWSGRGKEPVWIRGKDRKKFLIK